MGRKSTMPTRERLLEVLEKWDYSASMAAFTFNVADSTVQKWKKEYGIVTPTRCKKKFTYMKPTHQGDTERRD